MARLVLLVTYGTCVTSDLNYLRGFTECLKFADERLATCEMGNFKVLGTFIMSIYATLLVAIGAIQVQVLGRQLLLLCHLVHNSLVLMVTLQQVMLVLELLARFRSLNANLLDASVLPADARLRFLLGGTWPPNPHPVQRPSPPLAVSSLRQLQEAHVALMRAAELLQQHFGLSAAATIATSVCGATCSAYELLMALVEPHWITQYSVFYSASASALWLALHLTKVVSLALSSAVAADSASTTGLILLRASALSTRYSPEHEAFLRLTLLGPPLRFTAAGFVTVDRRLLVSGIAVVITYVVILGQLTVAQ
ncbi:gustatory and pheromone receptor 32a-like [Schistocerca serialis cubense]|uniref:gustatory and pheromone receptor 32a-like n=1 Tax=Schistocerca serialis cubense TaxID=2023355 RepID=UPI00214EF7F5|nr:gustatory and pheromone receptor 32a-like [Schistocerca serialis cubense]